MNVLGIDPGLDGGLVLIGDDGELTLMLMPTLATGKGGRRVIDCAGLARLMQDLPAETVACIEGQSAMRGYGVSSAFSLGLTYGALRQALASAGIPHEGVKPQTWQREFGIVGRGQRTKAKALEVALGLWPMQDFRASERCRVAHDGLVDAALIAEFGRRKFAGGMAA